MQFRAFVKRCGLTYNLDLCCCCKCNDKLIRQIYVIHVLVLLKLQSIFMLIKLKLKRAGCRISLELVASTDQAMYPEL